MCQWLIEIIYLLTSKFLKLSASHKQQQREPRGSDGAGLVAGANDTILPEAAGVTQSFRNFLLKKSFHDLS